jgi:hypothetical protein
MRIVNGFSVSSGANIREAFSGSLTGSCPNFWPNYGFKINGIYAFLIMNIYIYIFLYMALNNTVVLFVHKSSQKTLPKLMYVQSNGTSLYIHFRHDRIDYKVLNKVYPDSWR